jgi:hypothetical protein
MNGSRREMFIMGIGFMSKPLQYIEQSH